MDRLPSYDELPVGEGKPARSSWGLWGDDDVLGCLNLLTEERALRGAGLVHRGAVFALCFDLELPDPPLFGRMAFEHRVSWLQGEVGHDDELVGWNPQSSSQWDGFRHIRHPVHGFYNGVADDEHGVHHWAERGLAGRGVLADVGRWREAQGRPLHMDQADPIEPDELTATLHDQGVEVEPGDVLLVRTGWVGWYRSLDDAGRRHLAENHQNPGLRPGDDLLRTLWDLHIAAVAADNPSLELWPPGTGQSSDQLREAFSNPERLPEYFAHFGLLPLLGMPIGEMWDLEALAADCADDGVYDFLLTSAPLRLRSGVASPPNAMAIK